MKSAMMVMEMVMWGLWVDDSYAVKGVWLAIKSAFDIYEQRYEEIVPRDTKRAKIAPPRGGSGRAADRSACKIEHRPSETGR